MTPDRLARVEDLFHAARERTPEDRAAFLALECAGDSDLRREVESLLAQPDGSLLEQGLGAAASAVVAAPLRGHHGGRALGPYQLGALLGSGGMGDVYRARDTKLGRDVAVKILPEALGQHPDRLARFDREARILAALNHPHIAAIYGLEESDGLRGLVLELVDGVTLQERLDLGALDVAEALALARQIADALAAAHQKGIVHRDLKPANIKIAPRGVVKVLDFGLAKLDASDVSGAAGVPVLETRDGIVLGTVAYMSPEQARGFPVDKRTDIWAFGCVLYEMLTGVRSFPGDTAADVFGAITSADPDWTRLPRETPGRIRDLLRRCLRKDPDRRLHDLADARIEIDDAMLDPQAADATARHDRAETPTRRRLLPWLVSGVMAAAAAVAIWLAISAAPSPAGRPARLSIPLPPDVSLFAIGRGSSVAVSPDGQRVVYVGMSDGRRQLYMRLLDGSDSTPIAGTEDGANPFFSPDGRWIGFTEMPQGGNLKRVPVQGGRVLTILNSMGDDGLKGFGAHGLTWAPDDTIVFGAINPRSHGLWRVPAAGGTPQRLTTPRTGEGLHTWPQLLPGGRAVIYTIWNNTGFEGARIVVQSLSGGEPGILVERASYGRVVSPDGQRAWLVYARPDGLLAAPFDLEGLRVSGREMPVLDGVLVNMSGGAQFSVSPGGLLAYIPGGLDERNKTALWVARDGTATEIGMIPGLGFVYRLSPDGSRLVRSNAGGGNRDLWVDDLARGGTPTRLTDGAVTNNPIWTPDGLRVIYASGQPHNLFWRAADRSDGEERLTTSPNNQTASSVSPDGTTLAYYETHPERGTDIWLLPLQGSRQPRLFLGTPFGELEPMFSPDGRWLAYKTNMSGQMEIWIKALAGGGEFPVSKGGGNRPLWSPDGRELYYRSVDPSQGGDMMAVSIETTGATPKIGAPRVLFPSPYQGNGDIAPDGRFLLLKRTLEESPSRVIQLVLNWFEDLQAKVPVQ